MTNWGLGITYNIYIKYLLPNGFGHSYFDVLQYYIHALLKNTMTSHPSHSLPLGIWVKIFNHLINVQQP